MRLHILSCGSPAADLQCPGHQCMSITEASATAVRVRVGLGGQRRMMRLGVMQVVALVMQGRLVVHGPGERASMQVFTRDSTALVLCPPRTYTPVGALLV